MSLPNDRAGNVRAWSQRSDQFTEGLQWLVIERKMYMRNLSSFIRSLSKATTAIVSLLVSLAAWAGQPGDVLDSNHAKVQQVMAVQQAVTASLMRQPEILGTAVGLDRAGEPALVIYVDRGAQGASEAVRALPPQIRGVSVKGHLTEKFVAFAGKPSRGVSHTAKQTSPLGLQG